MTCNFCCFVFLSQGYTINGCSLRDGWKDGASIGHPGHSIRVLSCVRCGVWNTETHVMSAYSASSKVYNSEDKYNLGSIKVRYLILINITLISQIRPLFFSLF